MGKQSREIDARGVAKLCGVHVSSVHRWNTKGLLDFPKATNKPSGKAHNKLVWNKVAVKEWLKMRG